MVSVYESFAIIFIVAVGLFVKQFLDRKKHPPGPLGIPIVGVRPFQLAQFLFPKLFSPISEKEYFRKMKAKYGDVWSIDIGGRRIVVLASVEAVTEAFVNNARLFSGRPNLKSLKILSEDSGIFVTEGETWEASRQLALKAFRDLGMGKQVLENQICEELDLLMDSMEKNITRRVRSPSSFIKTSSNIISKLIFNERNKYNDSEFDSFIKDMKTISHFNAAGNTMELFSKIVPIKMMRRIFPVVDEFIRASSECMKFVEKKCKARIKVESEMAKPNCILDFFWRYRYQDYPDMKYEEKFHDISHSMFDLLVAGTDTINNVIGFSFLLLGNDLDLQKSLRKELQALVDDHRLINMEHRRKCPKLLSFIDEVYRFCPLDTLFFRRAMSDCVFRGYNIYSNDIIFGDVIAITRDPEHFDHPEVFDAYRFLDETKTQYIPNRSVIPFGIGKRACPGESLALMELFLILSKMLLRFEISLTDETINNFDKILEGTEGLVHSPLEHDIIFQPFDLMK